MAAKLGRGGYIDAWLAKVAAPAALTQLWARIANGALPHEAVESAGTTTEKAAISGMIPPYNLGSIAIDHHPAAVGLPSGRWRGNADPYAAFFNECFIRSEEHTSELQSLMRISYAVFCLNTTHITHGIIPISISHSLITRNRTLSNSDLIC